MNENTKKFCIIGVTILISVVAYFIIKATYPFETDEDTFHNIALIIKTLFVLFDMGVAVAVLK